MRATDGQAEGQLFSNSAQKQHITDTGSRPRRLNFQPCLFKTKHVERGA
uniref:Uncharacterized protein n=1 Tax=Anguilla anguilla TaxID=7936 RepID=A0A0E9VVZ8_ANGAN